MITTQHIRKFSSAQWNRSFWQFSIKKVKPSDYKYKTLKTHTLSHTHRDAWATAFSNAWDTYMAACREVA